VPKQQIAILEMDLFTTEKSPSLSN